MIPEVFRDGKWGLNLEDGLGLFGGRRGDIMKQNLRRTGCRDLESDLNLYCCLDEAEAGFSVNM